MSNNKQKDEYLSPEEQKHIRTIVDEKGVKTGTNIYDLYDKEEKHLTQWSSTEEKNRKAITEPYGLPGQVYNFHPDTTLRDMNKCPKCGSLAKTILYSTTTLVAYASTSFDEQGCVIYNPNPNTTTNYYRCDKCGENYSGKQ